MRGWVSTNFRTNLLRKIRVADCRLSHQNIFVPEYIPFRSNINVCEALAMHINCEPPILYFGTPVTLISTVNEDAGSNLAPMSSSVRACGRVHNEERRRASYRSQQMATTHRELSTILRAWSAPARFNVGDCIRSIIDRSGKRLGSMNKSKKQKSLNRHPNS